jgi:hypothetical protein
MVRAVRGGEVRAGRDDALAFDADGPAVVALLAVEHGRRPQEDAAHRVHFPDPGADTPRR